MRMKADNPVAIVIGYLGENEVNKVEFEFGSWIEQFGSGQLNLLVKRFGDTDPYPVVVSVDENIGTWNISSADTAVKGTGLAQLVYVVDEKIKKSSSFAFTVLNSLTGSADPPQPYEDYVQEVLNAAAEALLAVEHYPKIVDGYWNVWDPENEEWIDTGVDARGVKGDPGVPGAPGEPGATGNGIASTVLNDNYTLTINFTNGSSYTTPSIRGERGEPTDVQINGTSIVSSGVANIPLASANDYGVAKVSGQRGLSVNGSGELVTNRASSLQVKAGANTYNPVTPVCQHEATFYGLASASGDITQSASINPVGTYTDSAKAKIQNMLGILDMIAPYEASATASQAYATGSCFAYNGKLYKATSDIAQNGAIVPGTNCTQTTLIELIG